MFSQQSIEERWSAPLGGSRTKTLIFGHFRTFRTTAFTFHLSDTLQKHSLAGVEFFRIFHFFPFTCKRWSQYNSTTKPWAEITAVELSGTPVHLPARVDVAHTLGFLFSHRSAVESQKCRGARLSNHPPPPASHPPVQLSITRLLR